MNLLKVAIKKRMFKLKKYSTVEKLKHGTGYKLIYGTKRQIKINLIRQKSVR